MNKLTPSAEYKLFIALCDLIECADDFTQLKLLASVCDILYTPSDPNQAIFFQKLQNTARHLRGLPEILYPVTHENASS